MGSVYAKESNLRNGPIQPNPRSSKNQLNESENYGAKKPQLDLNLQKIKAKVDKVHVDGLGRTKDDIVKAQVAELFQSNNFNDLIQNAYRVKEKLESLGCFKNINIYLDTSNGPDATPEGVEVTYSVRELSRLSGGVNTAIGNNEGSIMVKGRLPNILGRGEQIQMDYLYGSQKSASLNLSLMKPFFSGKRHKILTTSLFGTSSDFLWSGYTEKDKGLLIDLELNQNVRGVLKHNFQYEAAVRDIIACKQASFHVREQSGPTLKSAVRYICSIDKRDEHIFPTRGFLAKLTTELAGLGGNIGFVKNEVIMQANWTPYDFCTFQLGLQTGLLRSISNEMKISIADHFFLGGPMNLRGFAMRGCGPQVEGNAIGADFYWASALHVYTPLPFKPSIFGDIFRLHGFINGGTLTNISFNSNENYADHWKTITQNARCATGCGLAMKLGNIARVELNFVFPILFHNNDVLREFQFGIGMYYL